MTLLVTSRIPGRQLPQEPIGRGSRWLHHSLSLQLIHGYAHVQKTHAGVGAGRASCPAGAQQFGRPDAGADPGAATTVTQCIWEEGVWDGR